MQLPLYLTHEMLILSVFLQHFSLHAELHLQLQHTDRRREYWVREL